MSPENVEIVRRGIEAVNRENLEALLDLCDPQIEWWDRADDPGAADVHRGHEGVAGFLTNLLKQSNGTSRSKTASMLGTS